RCPVVCRPRRYLLRSASDREIWEAMGLKQRLLHRARFWRLRTRHIWTAYLCRSNHGRAGEKRLPAGNRCPDFFKACQQSTVPTRKILWQLLRARLLPGIFRSDAYFASGLPHISDGCPPVSPSPLFQAFHDDCGHHLPPICRGLLHCRDINAQPEDGLRVGNFLLPAHVFLRVLLVERVTAAMASAC